MTADSPTILLAGGGTGGHIFPNIAVAESLLEQRPDVHVELLVSQRPVDAKILVDGPYAFTALPAAPLARSPLRWPATLKAFRRSVRTAANLIAARQPAALVATGGFVSGPAVHAAHAAGVPVAIVNLDAVPGRANKLMAKRATTVFTVYPLRQLPAATRIGLPLRAAARASVDPNQARAQLGLDPARRTLLVTGASQGAQSINAAMAALAARDDIRAALHGWQILHLTGDNDSSALEAAYGDASIPCRIEAFIDEMGLAWAAADAAVSRAGAGSVGEVWAAAVPAIFMPYPFHRDQHQKHNAQPLVDVGGAVIVTDLVNADANAKSLAPALVELLADPGRRDGMRAKLAETRPPDGAAAVASWLIERL